MYASFSSIMIQMLLNNNWYSKFCYNTSYDIHVYFVLQALPRLQHAQTEPFNLHKFQNIYKRAVRMSELSIEYD